MAKDERTPTGRRITRIAVSRLFGVFSHEIRLRQDGRVTILLGPNGVGKTQLLECTRAICSGKLAQLARVPFDELIVELENGDGVVVTQTERKRSIPPKARRKGLQRISSRVVKVHRLVARRRVEEWDPEAVVEAEIDPALLRRLSNLAEAESNQMRLFIDAQWSHLRSDKDALSHAPEWFQAFVASTAVSLVETQRLLHRPSAKREGSDEVHLEVKHIAEDLAKHMLSLPPISGHPKKRDNARGVFDVTSKEVAASAAQIFS